MNPSNTPENLVNQPATPEQNQSNSSSPEMSPVGAEQAVPTQETPPAATIITPVPTPVQAPAPAPTASIEHTQPTEASKLEAADSDVIEKVWVDQAEKIINQNQDNPFEEQDQEDELSRKYKKQRFNIDVNDE